MEKKNANLTDPKTIPQLVKQIKQSANSPYLGEDGKNAALPNIIFDLTEKTGIDYDRLNLLRNPLLPRGIKDSQQILENHNKRSLVSVFTMCENVNTCPEKVFKDV